MAKPDSEPDLSNPTPTDAPLVALVRANPATMTDDELRKYINSIRALRGSHQTRKAEITRPAKKLASGYDLEALMS